MKVLEIDGNWKIESDGENCTLLFEETRTRKKIDKDKKPTGETEDYLYRESFYYPTIYSALKSFLNKSMEEAKDVKSCVVLVEKTFEDLKKLSFNSFSAK